MNIQVVELMGQELSKKEQKAKEKEEQLNQLYDLIKSQKFAIEVDQIIYSDGTIYQVNPSINFFLMKGDETNINFPQGGSNYYGSKTRGTVNYGNNNTMLSEGMVNNFVINDRKKGKPIIANGLIIPLTGGSMRFSISCNSSGNVSVTLRIQNGDQTTLQGKIYSLEDAKVYNRIRAIKGE
jgi:hypothetical protein